MCTRPRGTFADPHALATKLAGSLMAIEEVPNIPMFRKNTAAFVHDLPASSISNVDGDGNYVRVCRFSRTPERSIGKSSSP
jgi:hypothetical protein